MPGIAGIARVEQRPSRSSKVNASGITIVGGHGFTKNCDVGVGLREAPGEQLPGTAAIAASGYTEFSLRDKTLFGRIDRDGEQRLLFGGGDGEREAEARGQTFRDVCPFFGVEIGAVDAAVVLLVKRVGIARMSFQLVDALADFRKFDGRKIREDVAVERRPGFAGIVGTEGARSGNAHN